MLSIMRGCGALLFGFLAACSGGDDSPLAPAQTGITGNWRATKAEFVSRSNSAIRIEVVARGASLVIVLDGAGTYTFTLTEPGKAPMSTGGTWSASRDVLTLKQTGMSGQIQFDMSLSGNTLALERGHVLFDFQGNGTLTEATLSMTLARQ